MEQFSLEKWLQDKSRKVVTKTGEEVKIIDTNAPDKNNPIVGYIYHKQKWNGPWTWHIDGVYKFRGDDDMDLFFADEEEDEFETTMISFAHTMFDHLLDVNKEVNVEEWKNKLLGLARKELQPELDKEMDKLLKATDKVVERKGYERGREDVLEEMKEILRTEYDKGRADVIEEMPKWKKATEDKDLEKHIAILEDGKVLLSNYLEEGDYYIDLEDLKTLPKEE